MTSEELKTWRQNNDFSQSQLAAVLGVDVMTISRWERRVREIPSFLHLALKWLEKEGGGLKARDTKKKTKKERKVKR